MEKHVGAQHHGDDLDADSFEKNEPLFTENEKQSETTSQKCAAVCVEHGSARGVVIHPKRY